MNEYRERHEKAVASLETAKDISREKYSLPNKSILFKRTDRAGRVSVGIKSWEGRNDFKALKKEAITSLGIDIDSLPDYHEFSNQYRELLKPAENYFKHIRELSKEQIQKAKDTFIYPYYAQRKEVYNEYLLSPEWQEKRNQVFMVQGTLCKECGKPACDIHHLSYENLGHEDPEKDLIPLCRDCHLLKH